MGRTPAPERIRSAENVLDVLLEFIDGSLGDRPLLVVGHSAGAYFAQAVAGRRPDQVVGLAMLCPLLARLHDVPAHEVIYRSGNFGNAEFRDYFTVQTAETFYRYQTYVEPAARLVDQAALTRIGEQWELSARPREMAPYRRPTLLVAGRQDSTVGYAAVWDLLERYPRATFAVLDGAGHALPHEQPHLLCALVTEWLDRVRAHPSA
jgi:pimeloyl-ACP methyl ester carboxylesterase